MPEFRFGQSVYSNRRVWRCRPEESPVLPPPSGEARGPPFRAETGRADSSGESFPSRNTQDPPDQEDPSKGDTLERGGFTPA